MPSSKAGDEVVLNGWGVGEAHYGGYAGRARVKGDWLIKRPATLSAGEAMAIGTAGYTAMLAVLALERNGVTPSKGPVIVTGAAGGVGSVAIILLARLGYRVIASTGRTSEADYLTALGRPRSSSGRNCRARRGRSARSVGPAASTPSVATRLPMFWP